MLSVHHPHTQGVYSQANVCATLSLVYRNKGTLEPA